MIKSRGYYAAFVALGLVAASLGPTLPDLAAQTGTLLSQVSFLFAARALGNLLAALVVSRFYDRWPGHPVIAGALLALSASMALVPTIPWLWVLAVVILILGMAENTVDVGGNTLLMWVHGERVGPFMNGLHFCFGLGAFLSPIIIAQVALFTGEAMRAYWVLALLLLPAAVWLLRQPSPRTGHHAAPRNAAGAPDRSLVLLIATFMFLYVGAEVGLGGWVYSYALAKGLSDATAAAYLTSTFWGALTLGRLLAIPIAARVRPRTILMVDLLGCLASVGALWLWPTAPGVVWLGTFGAGLCLASVFPTTLALAERRMRITGRVTGWFFVGANAGAMFLPWLIGQLFEPLGPDVVMIAILADVVVALALLAALLRRSGRRLSAAMGQGVY
ncbi:MAG: MFS transporter [Chloroflexi bacterium]|nr:MFS transporter [Chloroflexota bacterium]MBU1748511.1 MFS transporter [Chloroflexota bacterium]